MDEPEFGVGRGTEHRSESFAVIGCWIAPYAALQTADVVSVHDGHSPRCVEHALALTGNTASAMVTARLRELLAESNPYRNLSRVNELRDRIWAAAR
jgi:hypothetical protein